MGKKKMTTATGTQIDEIRRKRKMMTTTQIDKMSEGITGF